MIDIQQKKEQYLTLSLKVKELYKLLDIDKLKKRINDLEVEMSNSTFWDDQNKVKETTQELSSIKRKTAMYDECVNLIEEIEISIVLLEDGSDIDINSSLIKLNNQLEKLFNSLLLGQKFDNNNAIVDIHAGAGGTEAQDWVEMIYRMYTRYCNLQGFTLKVINYHAGDPVGIKSISFEVHGEDVFGLLKGERGVHRLIRISPFDSSGKRHTSFASVDVVPILTEVDETVIEKSDLKIDTFRASGAGGQSVNTTDSAVRITHIPTGIIVSCQNERSQLKNKEYAMRMLANKLAAKAEEDRQALIDSSSINKSSNAWGSQIRTYTFQPYVLVKDHRTGFESGNVKDVLDGNLDKFILSYLQFLSKRDEVNND